MPLTLAWKRTYCLDHCTYDSSVCLEPSGGGSREIDCDEGAALERSGRVKEPEEATESILFQTDRAAQALLKTWLRAWNIHP